jgi:Trk K+ transport system NAD-binding subunit
MRKNHIIIAGATPLAQSVYEGLRQRGHNVTVVVPEGVPHGYPADTDLIQGDPTDASVLTEAGAAHAEYVLALRDDDAENAFIVLAAKEVAGPGTRTVALANTATHLQKIKSVNPDMVFSLQLLGSEILLRTLSGEPLLTAEGFQKTARAILKTNIASQTGREDYVRVSFERADGKIYATPLPSKSGAIFTLVKADGMIRIDLNQEGIEAGEEVEVMLF